MNMAELTGIADGAANVCPLFGAYFLYKLLTFIQGNGFMPRQSQIVPLLMTSNLAVYKELTIVSLGKDLSVNIVTSTS